MAVFSFQYPGRYIPGRRITIATTTGTTPKPRELSQWAGIVPSIILPYGILPGYSLIGCYLLRVGMVLLVSWDRVHTHNGSGEKPSGIGMCRWHFRRMRVPTGTPTSVRQDPDLTGSLTGHQARSPLGKAHNISDDSDDDEMFRHTDQENYVS